jgi:hypothetical protein
VNRGGIVAVALGALLGSAAAADEHRASAEVASVLLPHVEDVARALPSPPKKVQLENSYGTVTFNHAGHLSRRTPCKACHGAGPIQKIGRFQPREAHDTCRACHVKVARGPTDCGGCHVKKVEQPVLAAPAPNPDAQAAAKSAPVAYASLVPGAQPASYDPEAAAAAFDAAAAWGKPAAVETAPGPGTTALPGASAMAASASRRTVFAGVSMLTASGASLAPGVSLGITLQQDGFQLSEILEWAAGSGSRRGLGLMAAGIVFPVRDRFTAHVLGVAGFDAADVRWTTFLPALGARAGFEWTGPYRFVQSVDLSLTALTDVTRAHDPRGNAVGGSLLSVSLSAGMELTGRP